MWRPTDPYILLQASIQLVNAGCQRSDRCTLGHWNTGPHEFFALSLTNWVQSTISVMSEDVAHACVDYMKALIWPVRQWPPSIHLRMRAPGRRLGRIT